MPAKLVAPLTLNWLTLLNAAPKLKLPTMSKLLPTPAIVELAAVVTLAAVSVVFAPKVIAPVKVSLPETLIEPPFSAIAEAVISTCDRRLVAPRVPPKLTVAPVPLAMMFKVRLAAESLLMLLTTAIVALAPVLCSVVFCVSVKLPV